MGDDKQNRAAVEAWAALKTVVDNNDGVGPPQGFLDLTLMWDVDRACYVAKASAGEAHITVEAPRLDAAVVACTMADGDGDFLKLDHDGRLLCGECEGRDHYPCEECRGSGYREPPPGWTALMLRSFVVGVGVATVASDPIVRERGSCSLSPTTAPPGSPWAALKSVVDNTGGEGPPAGMVEVTLRWDVEKARYIVAVKDGYISASADAPTLEVAVVACSMADEGVHYMVGTDGQLLCIECEGVVAPEGEPGCEACAGTGISETESARLGWPKGGLKVPASRTPELVSLTFDEIKRGRKVIRYRTLVDLRALNGASMAAGSVADGVRVGHMVFFKVGILLLSTYVAQVAAVVEPS